MYSTCTNYVYMYVVISYYSNVMFLNLLFFQAPEEDYFSVHIRIVGDWTRKSNSLTQNMYMYIGHFTFSYIVHNIHCILYSLTIPLFYLTCTELA